MSRPTATATESAARARRPIHAAEVVALFEKRQLHIGPDEAQALADDANALASRPGETRTARAIATRLADVEALAMESFSVNPNGATE